MRWLVLAALVALSAAAPAHVVFVVDGAPEWQSLMSALPKADVYMRMTPAGGSQPESAEAASAMSTGCVGSRRAVAVRGVPLGVRAARAGAATGAVTNVCLTDPTVAAFFVAAPDRYNTAMLAASMRAAGLAVSMGGSSRLIMPLNATGDVCFPNTRAALVASLGACPAQRPLMGAFGDARTAMAAECLPLPFANDNRTRTMLLPSLDDMTRAALSRLKATHPGRSVFLVVGSDRLDQAAHAGYVDACKAEVAATAAAVNSTLSALSARLRAGDALVIVTADHGTIMNTNHHTNRTVPVLIYGAGAVAAAERAMGSPLTNAHMMRPPVIAAVDFPRLFPFFPSDDRRCSREPSDDTMSTAIIATTSVVLFIIASVLFWKLLVRRKVE